jgi:prepilin-type processing-associated H-X9-DG protein
MTQMNEEARTAKCQNNLKRVMTVVQMHAVDHDESLPGPIYPTVFRQMEQLSATARSTMFAAYLRPYLTPGHPSIADPTIANPKVDEILRCPTASMLAPDSDFGTMLTFGLPMSYICNTWGPLQDIDRQWFHTDPPFYFGFHSLISTNNAQPPKKLGSVRNPGAEWAIGDAWYRNVVAPGGRPGGPRKRPAIGTFPLEVGGDGGGSEIVPIPSAPYHRVAPREGRSHMHWNVPTLPALDFDGQTNLAYFDGHVGPLRDHWQEVGHGGTVNPYWSMWGGRHTSWPGQ